MEKLNNSPVNNENTDFVTKVSEAELFIAENPTLSANLKVQELQSKGFLDLEGREIDDPVGLMRSFLANLESENEDPSETEQRLQDARVIHSNDPSLHSDLNS